MPVTHVRIAGMNLPVYGTAANFRRERAAQERLSQSQTNRGTANSNSNQIPNAAANKK